MRDFNMYDFVKLKLFHVKNIGDSSPGQFLVLLRPMHLDMPENRFFLESRN